MPVTKAINKRSLDSIPGHRNFHPTMMDDLGARVDLPPEELCPNGFPHAWDPEGCHLDNVIEEDINEASETHFETKEHLRQSAHAHMGCPTKWDVARARAEPDAPDATEAPAVSPAVPEVK